MVQNMSHSHTGVQVGNGLMCSTTQCGELPGERRKMERPKTHREQAVMLAGLIEEANDLPPILLTAAAQRRWALEFEGETLMTYRRGGEDR